MPDAKHSTVTKTPDVTPTRIKSEDAYEASRSTLAFRSAPQTCVRWLRTGGREAIAMVGSGDGQVDEISFYGVWTDGDGLHHAVRRELPHTGKVTALDAGSDGLLAIGSSRGNVQVLRAEDWAESWPTDVGDIARIRGREESVVGVVALGDRVCVAGEHGSICMMTVEAGKGMGECAAWGEQFDGVGLYALSVVNEGAGQVVGAGGCGVTVWDVRNGSVRSRVQHPAHQVATAVTADLAQPHIIIAGFRNGEVCVWDQRAGDNADPVSRAAVHDGPVWDVRVVTCSRAGRLMTCGEDGRVLLLDYALAAARDATESWSGNGEFWRAAIRTGDVRSLIGNSRLALGVNGIDAHWSAELFAYVSDSAQVGFGALSS